MSREQRVDGVWCFYVGQAAAGNFTLGRKAGTWGVNRRAKIKDITKGDRVIFVERLQGWSRSSPEKFSTEIRTAATILVAEVTSDIFEDTSPLWPDGEYPFRFHFEEIQAFEDVELKDIASPEVIEAVRMSGINQSSAAFAEGANPLGDALSAATDPHPASLEELAEATHMASQELMEIESLLLEKKQIVLEGPPGSGKTFVARMFARYFTGNRLAGKPDETVELVQFHQSYGYEDFVQGIRPVTDPDGSLRYHVQPGIFMNFCARAAKDTNQRHVIIIDEINRGNISRIFGELLLLLEYRDEEVRLPYGTGTGDQDDSFFAIPPNVYIIGTMNSTDRSLSLIDYALRRRFYFYQFLPMQNGRAPVLENWLRSRQDFDEDARSRILTLFVNLNTRIQEYLPEDFQIGHSYFMSSDIAEDDKLKRVWRRAVMPLLAEYFHSSREAEDILSTFDLPLLLEPATRVQDFGWARE